MLGRPRAPPRGGAGARLRRPRHRAERPRGVHDRADRAGDDRAGAAPVRRRDPASGSSSCSGRPSAGARRPRNMLWHHAEVLVPNFTGPTTFRDPGPVQLRPGGRGGQVLLRRCPTARCRWRSTSTAPSSTARTTGGCRCRSCRGAARPAFRMPVADVARGDRPLLPVRALDRGARRHAARRCSARSAARGRRRWTRASRDCWRRRPVNEGVERLVDSLLCEGYALYPYTPGCDEELDADAVRDRLPAGLRATGAAPSTTCGWSACLRSRAAVTRRGALPAAAAAQRHEAVERRIELGAGRGRGRRSPPLRPARPADRRRLAA